MSLFAGKEQDEQTLAQEYRQCLQAVRDLIPGLEDPTDINKTAQWIGRFNRAKPDEQVVRNRCARLLLQQLREDNLTHPFIFQRFLNEPLEMLLEHDPETVGDGPLEPLHVLAEQVETLNERTAEDICQLRCHSPEVNTQRQSTGDGENYYASHLQTTLQSALLLRVPDIIENPEAAVPDPPDTLQAVDRDWLTVVLNGIKAKVMERTLVERQKEAQPSTLPAPIYRSVESQTVEPQTVDPVPNVRSPGVDRDEIESYLERKFAKLYASFRVREKALEIRTQSAGGMHLIDMSQRLVRQYRRSAPPGMLLRSGHTDRNRRRADN